MSEELKKQREQQIAQDQLVTTKVAEVTAHLNKEHDAALQSAVADATSKAKAESQAANVDTSSSSQLHPDMEAVVTQHKQELADLEARLTQKYEAEAKTHKESAANADGTPEAVENIVKERMEAFQKEHEQKLTDAIERGRREVNMKLKLKDGQLAKALAGRKELEEQIKVLKEQLNAAGITASAPTTSATGTIITAVESVPSTPAKNLGATSTTLNATPTVPPAPPTTPATSAGPSTLPPKPPATVVPVSKPTAPSQATTTSVRGAAARGRGRGMSIRGGAAAGRGGGVLAQVNSAAAASPSGTSILGAAAKRPREETEAAPPDAQSLAKRLRGTPPVTLHRNRPLPSTDTPQ